MAFVFIASGILGLVIGVRCRVYALVPVTLVSVSVTAVVANLSDLGGSAALSLMALSGVSVQLGYVCGSFAASLKDQPASALHPVADKAARQYGLRVK